MSAVTKQKTELSLVSNQELSEVLRNSLYPGASDASIAMVFSYCKAAGLDPMQKPVHIVPMRDSKTKQYHDLIMPGIGLYRIQAARTGQYAGVSEPEYGPDTTAELDGTQVTFPAWCKIVVHRLLQNGVIAEFVAVERWMENYANSGYDKQRGVVSDAPNAMWKKRPYGQLAKCAEAQALRKAFPEIGAQPTAEEMEGKPLEGSDDSGAAVLPPKSRANVVAVEMSDDEFQAFLHRLSDRAAKANAWGSAFEVAKKRFNGQRLEEAIAFLKIEQRAFEREAQASQQAIAA